jgi:hypothetical protein
MFVLRFLVIRSEDEVGVNSALSCGSLSSSGGGTGRCGKAETGVGDRDGRREGNERTGDEDSDEADWVHICVFRLRQKDCFLKLMRREEQGGGMSYSAAPECAGGREACQHTF